MTENSYSPGLAGIVAAETSLSLIDGQLGNLHIGGFPIEEIAPKASYEEMLYLLWKGSLPDGKSLSEFSNKLSNARELSESTLALLREAKVQNLSVMDALRMSIGTLELGKNSADNHLENAIRSVSGIASIVATYWRFREGQDYVPPLNDLKHTANYLYMLTGTEPSTARIHGLETYLNTVIDHGLNASTFTARVIISTRSDIISAITGAVGALKGSLHGGAPGPALDMVFEIGHAERAEEYLRGKLENGERLMGFGHRVYKVRDPRADVLNRAALQFYEADGDMEFYELVRYVEAEALRLLEEYKPGRRLQTNVEFYTALLLHGLGLPTELFAPTFAVSRVGGWTAHCFEQIEVDRIFRPRALYTGEIDRTWRKVDER